MNRAGRPKIRAVVIEDASEQRNRLVSLLEEEGDIEVVACPSTTPEAVELIARTRPDVVVLDLHLRDGLSQHAIEQIMARTPTPILVLSHRIRDRRSPTAVEALVAGALEALPRPDRWTQQLGADLRRTARQVSQVQVIRHPRGNRRVREPRDDERRAQGRPVVAVAASTGGPGALATFLGGLAGLDAPVLVVQHLHPDFTAGLVDWMGRVSSLPVETAAHDQVARAGRVYLAPGEHHLRYVANGVLELATSPITTHRPSADELFTSVARSAGSKAIGVLLTGMGEDGARGLLAIHESGGRTFAQDEASSTVFGMPKAAARLGAVGEMVPIDKMADVVQRAVREVSR